MLELAEYKDVRHLAQVGDSLMCGGNGGASIVIKVATRGPVSHEAIVSRHAPTGPEGPLADAERVTYLESTSLGEANGVREGRVSELVDNYNGDVWLLMLSDEARARMNYARFYDFLYHQARGKSYDFKQAIQSGLDPLTEQLFDNHPAFAKEDFSKFFCSELGAALHEYSGALGCSVNASEVNPQDRVSWNIWKPTYYQLKGKPKKLRRFNCMDPCLWGEA